jgi:hypothetical protein
LNSNANPGPSVFKFIKFRIRLFTPSRRLSDACLPNRPAYCTNPEETKEIQRQVKELLDKGYVRESLSPCVVLVLLVPKKDASWRMCVDCCPINTITVRYCHPIP